MQAELFGEDECLEVQIIANQVILGTFTWKIFGNSLMSLIPLAPSNLVWILMYCI